MCVRAERIWTEESRKLFFPDISRLTIYKYGMHYKVLFAYAQANIKQIQRFFWKHIQILRKQKQCIYLFIKIHFRK